MFDDINDIAQFLYYKSALVKHVVLSGTGWLRSLNAESAESADNLCNLSICTTDGGIWPV